MALGVTGSVAAYKSVDLARWLIRRGARVRVVLTSEAERFVGRDLFHWATGETVLTALSGEVEHISLARSCDGVVVAPATLSTMAKIAYGIVDNPVALLAVSALGMGKRVMVVPAMHENMMRTRQYAAAVSELRASGVFVVPPRLEEGVAKYPDPLLLARLAAAFVDRGLDLAGARVLVTAGPTREWIDMVRFISNPSSGSMGVEVALEAYARGATVDLVHGPLRVEAPHVVESHYTETTEDMAEAVARLTAAREYDAVVAAAAPADYRPAGRFEGKIRSGQRLRLELEPTPKVISSIRRRPRVLVAFAAEPDEDALVDYAVRKMEAYGADLVVANLVGPRRGFGEESLRAVLVRRGGEVEDLGLVQKEELARRIIDEVSSTLKASTAH